MVCLCFILVVGLFLTLFSLVFSEFIFVLHLIFCVLKYIHNKIFALNPFVCWTWFQKLEVNLVNGQLNEVNSSVFIWRMTPPPHAPQK